MQCDLTTFNLYDPRLVGEGLRIAVVRRLPRGVPKDEWRFDSWLPILAPSAELLTRFKQEEIGEAKFFQHYRVEMKRPDPRHVIELLAAVARRSPLTVGCHCKDASRCHRTVLAELIHKASGG